MRGNKRYAYAHTYARERNEAGATPGKWNAPGITA